MLRLAEEIPWRNSARGHGNWELLAAKAPAELLERVRQLLSTCADPDGALGWLVRMVGEKPAEFLRISQQPASLLHLVTVFSHSRFLAEEVIQQPEWLESLGRDEELYRPLGREEMELRLEQYLLNRTGGDPTALALAQFRRKMILRILLRDVLGLCTLSETTEELSNLADAVLDSTYRHIRDSLMRKHGTPLYLDGEGNPRRCGFSVLALGKLGGLELNYSSDIDLMFVYTANGNTDGQNSISNKEFFKKVATQYTALLSTYTAEGLGYRVDLRLRPDGKLGEVCISLDGARTYYQTRARDWELQMLIKARVCAGEVEPGKELLEAVEPMIYASTLDFSAVESVSATRERIQEKLAQRRGGDKELDVKLARGGIRDIEFLVQCLQRLHGGREQWVRHGGTLMALFRLRDKKLLSDTEYARLASAYEFQRHLEHRLQVDEDQQRHTLPRDRDSLELVARRMPLREAGTVASTEQMTREMYAHLAEVQEIYERVIHAQQPMYYGLMGQHPGHSEFLQSLEPVEVEPANTSNLIRFLDQKAPGLAGVVERTGLRRGDRNFQHFLERVLPNAQWLNWLDQDTVLAGYVLDVFEHSPYFGEELIRHPDMLGQIKVMREKRRAGRPYRETALLLSDPVELRRFFRREMLLLQSESICLQTPIFHTLSMTSELADAAIAAAYQMAIDDVRATFPPSGLDYEPWAQLMVVALGRLGMQEFDLASDADLVFVLPDEDAAEFPFWTKVAARLIDRLTAYTSEGMMFAVDTRLRPNGREGELVQLESTYKDYFTTKAQAWEGIAYMKSRAVAGDQERATRFLNELQELDWRRYGQSGRSQKQLRMMRMRLEKEQGLTNPLKAGRGGYYDIDFALMYLRLKGAGIFFKVLNTPARIDVIEKMGHLERADAEFLRDAATFYRAIDHGLRVGSGYAEGSLPEGQGQLQALTELVARWTPEHLHDQPLEQELEQIRSRTREFFDRTFG